MYKIEGYVETISSDGAFTIHGTDGYFLEREISDADGKKERKQYNVFWNKDASEVKIDKRVLVIENPNLSAPVLCWREWEYQMLVAAKVNHQKVQMDIELKSEKNENNDEKIEIEIENVTLLK